MAVPRAAILALVGIAAVAGVFLFTRVHKSSSDQAASGSQSQQSQAAKSSTSKPSASKAQSGSRDSAKPAVRQAGTVTPESLPKPLSIVIKNHIPVVVLFYLAGGADDNLVRQNLAAVHLHGVGLFEVPIAQIARYSKLATQVGVSSPPTLVVVNARGQATATTGYLDRRSIAQIVSDSVKSR